MADLFELYYGDPGSAKTRSILELIKKVNTETGKIARVFVGDGSKGMYISSGFVKKGIVKCMEFSVRDYPFTTCQQITEGYWPKDPDNPASEMYKLSTAEVAETGLWIFEGASVMGDYMMGTKKGGLSQRAAAGEVIGQELNIQFMDDKDHKFGGNSGAHYNVGQRHLHANIIRSKGYPGIVIWTAHERYDDGDRGGSFAKGQTAEKVKLGDKLIGPALVGKQLTPIISRDFNNTLHFTVAGKRVMAGKDESTDKTRYEEKTDYRIYTRDHYDPDGIVSLKYRAVNRGMYPKLIKDYYSSSEDNPGKGLLEFYADLEKSNETSDQS